MKRRLTISLDEDNIAFAKKYAKRENISVSHLFNKYLDELRQKHAHKKTFTPDKWVEKYAGIFELP